jgi:threonine/homoserine/homoserine lactone efflux protein
MSIELWLAFAAASSLMLIIPGPTTLLIVSYATSQGRSKTLPLMIAVELANITALVLSLLGLGQLLATSALAFTLAKTVGGLYLLYLGIKMLRSARGSNATLSTVTTTAVSRWKLFYNSYLVTALNPKSIIFFVAFLPQFIDVHSRLIPQMVLLCVTFVSLSAFLNTIAYAIFASAAREKLATSRIQKRFNALGGSLLSIAGIWTLFARRS